MEVFQVNSPERGGRPGVDTQHAGWISTCGMQRGLRNFKRSWNAICVKIGGRTDFSFHCDFQEENVHKALNKTGEGVVQKTLSQHL